MKQSSTSHLFSFETMKLNKSKVTLIAQIVVIWAMVVAAIAIIR